MMSSNGIKWRAAAVLVLVSAPVIFLIGVGFYHLWMTGWSFAAWVPMAGCFLLAYGLGWYWTRRPTAGTKVPGVDPPADYWTDRDRAAWELVEAHAHAASHLTAEQLADFEHNARDAKELALKIARIYKPGATEPFGHLTIPEIVTCTELVSQDMAILVEKYLPLSHVFTVDDWLRARKFVDKATEWYPRLRTVYWLGSAIFAPFRTAVQAAVTHAGMVPMYQQIQKNVINWLVTVYVHKFGRYLIELNSGRLRVGTKRYRELLDQHLIPPTEPDGSSIPMLPALDGEATPVPPRTPDEPVTVTVAIVGPVKAGKSSLVNALLGEQKAATDVVPLTPGATKYLLDEPGRPRLTLMDTAGYGNEGPTDADLDAALNAARDADVLILAAPARSAARASEVRFLTQLRDRFDAMPQLRIPTIVVSLSQIDKLTPAVEWAPPYDWKDGTRTKEQSVREALAAAKEHFGSVAQAIVPVCTAPGKEYGVRDDLLGTLAGVLGSARGVGLLRAFHAEAVADRTKRAVGQFLNLGKEAMKAVWDGMK